jgi:DNA-binding response OmpR family regulator
MFKNYLLVMTEFSALQNVMLIDDDDISLYLTSRRLEKEGFAQNIIKHESVDAAIADLQNNRNDINKLPDLIFLDINMPRKDGWDFLEELKNLELAYRAPVIMLTSSDSMMDKIKSSRYPNYVFGFFNKPLKVEDIMALIHFLKSKSISKL